MQAKPWSEALTITIHSAAVARPAKVLVRGLPLPLPLVLLVIATGLLLLSLYE